MAGTTEGGIISPLCAFVRIVRSPRSPPQLPFKKLLLSATATTRTNNSFHEMITTESRISRSHRSMTHQPENISAFAWGLEPLTMSSESPTKRRRTTTHKYIEQDLQQTMEMEIKTKGPAPRNRTKTWPCDASSSQQLSQDTPATLAQFSPATAALTMVAQHVKLPLGSGATAHYHGLRGLTSPHAPCCVSFETSRLNARGPLRGYGSAMRSQATVL